MGVSTGLAKLGEQGCVQLEPKDPICQLSLPDFGQLLGEPITNISHDTQEIFGRFDFRYVPVKPEEKEDLILKIVKNLYEKKFSVVGAERHQIWNNAWEKTAQRFAQTNNSNGALTPDFLDAHPVIRLNREFFRPVDASFEGNVFSVLRHWLYQQFFSSPDTIYEFGCGSGFNLLALAEMFPNKSLYGLDWTQSSVDLVTKIGLVKKLRLEGRLFDFFSPDPNLALRKNSAVLTVCALEQVGKNFWPFLQYLRNQRPQLCVHVEPIYEFYDKENLLDYLAIRYHSDRGYLQGFLPSLENLESEGQVEILKVKRMNFGSFYHEGYTCVVWRPV